MPTSPDFAANLMNPHKAVRRHSAGHGSIERINVSPTTIINAVATERLLEKDNGDQRAEEDTRFAQRLR
jgi:hypothetical protein